MKLATFRFQNETSAPIFKMSDDHRRERTLKLDLIRGPVIHDDKIAVLNSIYQKARSDRQGYIHNFEAPLAVGAGQDASITSREIIQVL